MKKILIPVIIVIVVLLIVLFINNNNNIVENDPTISNNIVEDEPIASNNSIVENDPIVSNEISADNIDNNTYKLHIVESSWSGWSPNYKPDEKENDYDIVLNKEYSIDSGNLTFKIIEINEDNIVIKTTESFSDNDDSINLMSNKKRFVVSYDKEIKLTEPTTDAGNIYKLKLVK